MSPLSMGPLAFSVKRVGLRPGTGDALRLVDSEAFILVGFIIKNEIKLI